ncbi:response regulator [Cellulomonas sp. H30R-01]|uniref:response regulator n=1 Tax=Cellulomonas sp. H30R-01 TaxID=2704467 RepID=UPI00138D98A5|nr:response regulator [Cellulomonas sp. H30R-01]QHT57139.1 response regulator [Cellulomonas sp. H30R-01]
MARGSLPQPTLQEIVRRAHILVVDDQEFLYANLFKSAGYNITKWRDITRLSDIEQGLYDLILLDLQGVGRKLSEDQGLGILRHIKDVRPSQVVIAYSNADWPVRYQPFFELADGVLPKSADYVDFKRMVDEQLQSHFSVGFRLSQIESELDDAGAGDWWTRRLARRAISDRDTARLERRLRRRDVDSARVSHIIALIEVAIGVAQIWTSAS